MPDDEWGTEGPEHIYLSLSEDGEEMLWSEDGLGCGDYPDTAYTRWDVVEKKVAELEAKLSELEAERARWELRASFLAVEAIDEYWMQSELKADPTEDDSPWVGRLDALIEESWPHAIRDNREG